MGGTARSGFFLEPAALHLNPDQRLTKGRAEQRLFKAHCYCFLVYNNCTDSEVHLELDAGN